MAVTQIPITAIQFTDDYDGAKLRRLVEDIQRTQRLVNQLVTLINLQQATIEALIARVTVLEGP